MVHLPSRNAFIRAKHLFVICGSIQKKRLHEDYIQKMGNKNSIYKRKQKSLIAWT